MEAKGDYLTFVDGDDWIEPQMYETLLAAMMEQDADLAVCRYRKIYENRRVDLSTPMAAVFEGQELLAKYLEEDEAWLIQTAVWNKLWKRSLSDGLRFPKSLYEDMYFTIRLLAHKWSILQKYKQGFQEMWPVWDSCGKSSKC